MNDGNSVVAKHEKQEAADSAYDKALQTAYDELSHDIETLRKAVRHVAEYNGVGYDDLIKEVKDFL